MTCLKGCKYPMRRSAYIPRHYREQEMHITCTSFPTKWQKPLSLLQQIWTDVSKMNTHVIVAWINEAAPAPFHQRSHRPKLTLNTLSNFTAFVSGGSACLNVSNVSCRSNATLVPQLRAYSNAIRRGESRPTRGYCICCRFSIATEKVATYHIYGSSGRAVRKLHSLTHPPHLRSTHSHRFFPKSERKGNSLFIAHWKLD